jgi:ribosome-binding protein aMBF1 (putative translation factor)
MRIAGTIEKEGKLWGIEIPALALSTQGRSKKEAYEMAVSVVKDAMDRQDLNIELIKVPTGFHLKIADVKATIAFILQRQRQDNGLSIREVARRLGSESPTAYHAYESGKRMPTVEKFEQILKAINKNLETLLQVA